MCSRQLNGAIRENYFVSQSTAGKGPGITFHTDSGTGAVRVTPRRRQRRAVLELLDASGGITQVRLSPEELRVLASALIKVAVALNAESIGEEITQS
jgi:hypothetical protein